MSIWEQLNNTGVRDSRVEAQERYDEEKKRQEEAARQQAESQKQVEEKRQKRTKDPLKPIKDAVRPAAQALEGAVQGAQEGLAGVLTGESPEQFRQRQQKGKERLQQVDKGIREASKADPGAETVRAGVGAVGRVAEGLIDTTSLIGDTAVTAVKAATGQPIDPKDNPFSAEYAAANTDLGLQAPNTLVGRLGRDLLAFGLTGIAAARRLPQAALGLGTGGAGIKGAIASGVVPGAIADFLLTSADDGNLSNLVQEMVPEQYRDTFMFALAADEDDNPWVVRTKAILEGAMVGAVADSFMWMVHGRFVARAKMRQGSTKEEALQAGLEAASNKKVELENQRLQNAQTETGRWSEAQEAEMRKLSVEEADFQRSIDEAAANGIPDVDPTLKNMKDELARIQLTKAQLENEVISGYRPDGGTRLPQEAAASMDVGDVNRAFIQQETLISGPLPRSVRRPGVSEAASVGNSPSIGGSERILTDANYRLMNMPEGPEQVVRSIEQRVSIQDLAESLKTTDAAVIQKSSIVVEDLMGVFRDTDGNPPDIIEALAELGGTQLLTPETGGPSVRILTREGVVAMKTIIAQTAEDIHLLAMNADAMRLARAADGNQFDRMLDRLESMVTLVKVTGNKFAGGLRSLQLTDADLRRVGVESDLGAMLSVKDMKARVDKIRNLKRIGSPEADAEIQALTRAMVLAGGDPTKTVSFARMIMSMGAKEAMKIMYNSLLSAPISHLKNALGNSYVTVERPTSLLLKGLLTGDEVAYRSAFAGYKAMHESIFEAWQVAATSFKTGDSINAKGRFVIDDFETQAYLNRLDTVAATPNEEVAVGWLRALHNFTHNEFFSAPTRALTGSDDFFKTVAARQQIKMEATASALTDPRYAGNFDEGIDDYLKAFSKKMDPETGRILDQELLNIADKATFQDDAGPMVNYLSKFLDAMPLGKVLVPFVRTPANLLRYGGTHVPGINLFVKEARQALMNPATTPAAMLLKSQYQGRMAIGAMALAAPAVLAYNDQLTGNGPPAGAERRAWLMVYQPMSIRIGNSWVSYQGIEPLSSIMSIAADAVMVGKMGAADVAERLIGQMTFAIAAALTEKSFLAGLSTISELLNAKTVAGPEFERSIYGTLNNFIPMAGARRTLYNIMQPYIMEVDGELQRAINVASGGLVMSGATRVDPLTGEETPSFAGNFYNAISPVRIQPADDDPVKKMLSDINFKIPSNTTGVGGTELTANDRNELSRTMFDLGLRERLEAVMKAPGFKEAALAHRGRTFDPNNPEQMPPHYRAVWAVWTGIQGNALRQMSRTNMDFRKRVITNKQAGRAMKGGRYEAVNQILNAPK
jgi:hypothetical protein